MENLLNLISNIKQNKPLIAALLIVSFVAVILATLALYNATTDNQREYRDPLSGETVYNPVDRTPESYNQERKITYLGFVKLIDYGVSFDNVELFKEELSPIKVDGNSLDEVSIDIDSITYTTVGENSVYEFNIRFNRKYDHLATVTIGKLDNSLSFEFSGENVDRITFE